MTVDVPTILLPRDPHHEFVRVMAHATVEKRTQDYDDALGLYLVRGASRFEAETKAARAIRPYEVIVGDYNAMVDNGIDLALLLLVGGGGTAYSNANARLGVGDSATAWATTQADLVAATNKLRKGMNATYPVTGVKKQTFRSDFLTGEANWVWNEWGIFTGATNDETPAHGRGLERPADHTCRRCRDSCVAHVATHDMARPTGLEPATFGSGTQRSIH